MRTPIVALLSLVLDLFACEANRSTEVQASLQNEIINGEWFYAPATAFSLVDDLGELIDSVQLFYK
jgi:hypothetical protein